MARAPRWTEEQTQTHFKTHRVSLVVSQEYDKALSDACLQQGIPSISEIHQQSLVFYKSFLSLNETSSFFVIDRENETRQPFNPKPIADPTSGDAGITLNLYDKFNKILEALSNPKNRATSPSATLRASFRHYAAYLDAIQNSKKEVLAKNRKTGHITNVSFLRY